LNNDELVRHGEELNEMGGFFVCNGNEKLIRIIVAPRANLVPIHPSQPINQSTHPSILILTRYLSIVIYLSLSLSRLLANGDEDEPQRIARTAVHRVRREHPLHATRPHHAVGDAALPLERHLHAALRDTQARVPRAGRHLAQGSCSDVHTT